MTTSVPATARALLSAGRWVHGLPDAFQEALWGCARVISLAPGQRLFARGDAPDGFYGVVSGAVRISAISERGREVLLLLAEPPQWFGEIAVFDGQPRTHDAIADDDSVLVHIPEAPLQAFLDAHPEHWRSLALLMTSKLRLAFMAIEDGASLPLPARVARRLLNMADGYGEWHDRSRRELTVRQEQLAAMLSTTRQTVNATLKELEVAGVLQLSYGKIEILDENALRKAAGFDDE